MGRGVKGLKRRGLVAVDKTFKKAPLSAVGYTAEHRYTLQEPFGPVGRAAKSFDPRRAVQREGRHG